MNVVDSSGWIEYFTEGPNSGFFAGAIENVDELIVPALGIYEVFKWVSRERGETQALKAIAHMQLGEVVDLDSKLAIYAARLSLQSKLPMADSVAGNVYIVPKEKRKPITSISATQSMKFAVSGGVTQTTSDSTEDPLSNLYNS